MIRKFLSIDKNQNFQHKTNEVLYFTTSDRNHLTCPTKSIKPNKKKYVKDDFLAKLLIEDYVWLYKKRNLNPPTKQIDKKILAILGNTMMTHRLASNILHTYIG